MALLVPKLSAPNWLLMLGTGAGVWAGWEKEAKGSRKGLLAGAPPWVVLPPNRLFVGGNIGCCWRMAEGNAACCCCCTGGALPLLPKRAMMESVDILPPTGAGGESSTFVVGD